MRAPTLTPSLTFAADIDPYSPLLNYGAVGAMLVAILFFSAVGVLYWRPAVDWLREQIQTLQRVNNELLASNQQAVPALTEAVNAMRAMADAVKDLRTELAANREELARNREEVARMREEIRGLTRGR